MKYDADYLIFLLEKKMIDVSPELEEEIEDLAYEQDDYNGYKFSDYEDLDGPYY